MSGALSEAGICSAAHLLQWQKGLFVSSPTLIQHANSCLLSVAVIWRESGAFGCDISRVWTHIHHLMTWHVNGKRQTCCVHVLSPPSVSFPPSLLLLLLLLLLLPLSLSDQTPPPHPLLLAPLQPQARPPLFLPSFCFSLSLPPSLLSAFRVVLQPSFLFILIAPFLLAIFLPLLRALLSFQSTPPPLLLYIQVPSLSTSPHTHRLLALLAHQLLTALLLFLSQFQPRFLSFSTSFPLFLGFYYT